MANGPRRFPPTARVRFLSRPIFKHRLAKSESTRSRLLYTRLERDLYRPARTSLYRNVLPAFLRIARFTTPPAAAVRHMPVSPENASAAAIIIR